VYLHQPNHWRSESRRGSGAGTATTPLHFSLLETYRSKNAKFEAKNSPLLGKFRGKIEILSIRISVRKLQLSALYFLTHDGAGLLEVNVAGPSLPFYPLFHPSISSLTSFVFFYLPIREFSNGLFSRFVVSIRSRVQMQTSRGESDKKCTAVTPSICTVWRSARLPSN